MIRYVKWTVLEVETGIFLIGIIGYLLISLATEYTSRESLGFLVGIAGSALWFWSMSVSAETSVDMVDPQMARRHAQKMYGVRSIVLIAAVMAAVKIDRFNVVTALAAFLSIKGGVYLQPLTHRLFKKWFHLNDEPGPDALILLDEEEDEEDEDAPDGIEQWIEQRYGK